MIKKASNSKVSTLAKEFTHLHVHSDYSFLDGAATVQGLAKRAARLGMKSLALTDHGVMCGLMDFKRACEREGVKPILGSEIYVVPHNRFEKAMVKGKEYAHMVLLAENDTGYRNLTKIVSKAYTEGFYRKPRADYELLEQYHEGLICLTACIGGEVPQALLQEKPEEAVCKIEAYRNIFGKDNLYLEVQNHKQSHAGVLEERVAEGMFKLADEMDVRCVLTNDSHFLDPDDFYAHNVMLCINTGRLMSDEDRLEYGPDFYLKTQEEMALLYPGRPDLLLNTMEIAERCNLSSNQEQKYYLPRFECPDGLSDQAYFDKLCREGLVKRYGAPLSEEIMQRYDFEFTTIKNMGFTSYFLITADLINWAKEQKIAVGPGRGSATGSIVAYALNITDIDPLRYNLLFERFLNPDRISMPDIDIDFCQERRGEVIDYVRRKYGEKSVCQIGTFGKLLSRAALKDVGRVLNFPVSRMNEMTKKIEVRQGKVPRIKEILETHDELREEYQSDSNIQELWDTAQKLEGMNRGTGVHAAGVVIAPGDLDDYLPLMRQKEDGEGDVVIATQYSMMEVEDQGLLKMDFLGLRNLTIIQRTLEIIKQDTDKQINLEELPLDDEKTYETLCSGAGFGVFQLESEGMCRLLKSIRPTNFEDISAVLAIYRPGPLSAGVDKQFAERKSGRQKAYMPGEEEGLASPEAVEKLQKIMEDTYGLLIYQEQAMRISRELGGFTPGEADLLRKAIGKKKHDLMNKLKPQFLEGCEKKGFGQKLGEHLWNQMEGFGSYGFNKSHTVGYGLITYQTAWLKTHYPAQYAAALVSSQIGNNDGIIYNVRGVRNMGIKILPPDINLSKAQFSTSKDKVVFGLSGMKGAGTKAIQHILEVRDTIGSFKGFLHMLENIDISIVNKAVIEALIRGGCFDSFQLKRPSLLASLEKVLPYVASLSADKARGQGNLFAPSSKDNTAAKETTLEEEHVRDLAAIDDLPDWTELEHQQAEKEAFGFYVTSSPLDTYAELLKRYQTHTSKSLEEESSGRQVLLGGMLTKLKKKKIQKAGSSNYGRTMVRFELQDHEGKVSGIAFPDQAEEYSELLKEDKVVFLRGITEEGNNGLNLTLSQVIAPEEAETFFGQDALLCYGKLFGMYSSHRNDQFFKVTEGTTVQLAGVAQGVALRQSKKGKEYLSFNLVNLDGTVKALCFGKCCEQAQRILRDQQGEMLQNKALVVQGSLRVESRGATFFADRVQPFEEAQKHLTKAVCIKLDAQKINRSLLEDLRSLVLKHKGNLPLFLRLEATGSPPDVIEIGENYGIDANGDFFSEVEENFGKHCLQVLAN